MLQKHYLLVINPAAGKNPYQRKLELATTVFEKKKYPFLVYITREKDPAAHLKTFLHQHPYLTDIIIVGGDGTINLVLNALPSFRYCLGFLSNGTGNDSIKPLSLPTSTEEQLLVILEGESKRIDLGICNGKYFMNGVGVGFDGEVVREMADHNRKKKGHWAYLSVVLKKLAGRFDWPVRMVLDQKELKQQIFRITVGKGTTFGGGFETNPKAQNDDGWLDVCVFDRLKILKRLYVLPMVQLGMHEKLPEVNFYKSRKVVITCPFSIHGHIDGELLESEEFEIEVVPQAIEVRVQKKTS